ncbi:CZB domain-containing protein [Acidovorax sp. IB03]|uniref:CZB domain-containing protein n=1 Tax=Acidovorax sp. IB03 TaxID=2779366 RepID=UPI0018E8E518|nr:CZB domain-containing protein [Acidovorax sp. IB03]MBJ2163506.1 CZB domain-containing protein [Acidovorax sp. IB03]
MDFFRRFLGVSASNAGAQAGPAGEAIALASPPEDSVPAELDVDAAINAHERWKARLMDYLEGRLPVGLDPDVIRRDDYSALGRWLHGVGADLLGPHPAYPLLMARHRYFHEQAAEMVQWAQQGEWDHVVAILNGRYRFASNQIVLLLKSIRQGVKQEA